MVLCTGCISGLHGTYALLLVDICIKSFVQCCYVSHACAVAQAVCTEAGMLALRERRMRVTQDDFRKAKERALYKKKGNIPEGLYV